MYVGLTYTLGMAVIRSALPDVKRPLCSVCGGAKVRRANGPQCPNCLGTGWEPRRRGPAPDPVVAGRIYDALVGLGHLLRTYRYEWTDEGATQRNQIRERIREVVTEGVQANLTVKSMAKAIGISRQALDDIFRGDPSGRNR